MRETILFKMVIIGLIVLLFLASSVHGEPDSFGTARNITIHENSLSMYPVWGGSTRFSTVDSGDVGISTSVALNSNGSTHISYADTANGHLKYAWQNSSGWNNYSKWYNATIDSSDNVGRGTSLKQDDSGYSHVSYLDSANNALKYAWQNESGWNIVTLESGGIGGVQTSLALDNTGHPHICYFNEASRHLKYTWQNGSVWWNITIDGTGTAADYTSLALDNRSHAHISYYDSVNGDLKYAWEDGIQWHRSTIDSEGDVGNSSSLALDRLGYSHISYLDVTNNHLKYAWQNTSGWFNTTVSPFPGSGGYSSLSLDSEGNAHISCSGGPSNSILYGTEYSGEFHFFPIDLAFNDGSERGGSYTSLALDNEGYFHMSYAYGSNPQLRYVYGHIGPIPLPNFTTNVTTGRAPLTVQFNDTSIGQPEQWGWSFGDSEYSTEQNPVHTYANAGHFLIEHSASNRNAAGTTHRYIDVFSIPVANFTGTPTSGTAPLTVSFTDLSTNNPTGWAWYFGDENYAAPWKHVNNSAGWSGRFSHSSVVMPDGSIVLMGGIDDSGYKNDTWRSIDNGVSWTEMNTSSGWSARGYHSSVVLPDGSIVLMGGAFPFVRMNDVWKSTDNGATWTQVTASAEWSAREGHSSVVMPDGSIVLMGGTAINGLKNDTWRSMDNGATWSQINASSGWSRRSTHSSVVMPDGSIVLMGGIYYNDTWRSIDNGATWTQVNASAGWTGRSIHSSVVMPDGSIVLMGGADYNGYKNDTWRSTDNGSTWTQTTASAEWSIRGAHRSVVMLDGSIVQMGGTNTGNYDTWRFSPVGSSAQNPSHTYTTPGTYQVSLQVYNAGGYNSTRKTGYIIVYPRDDSGSDSSDYTPSPTTTSGNTIIETVNVGGGSAVNRAELTGANLGKNLVITAFPRDNLPSNIVVPPTIVYQYISITSSTIPGVISQTTLDFCVPQSWLTEHGFTAGDIVMMRNENGEWKILETRFVSQNSGNVMYRATTPGFSYFAIVYQREGTDMGTSIPVATTAPNTLAIGGVPVTATPSLVSTTTEKTQAVPPAPVTLLREGEPLTTIIVEVIVVVAIITGAFLIRRWWIRKQNPALFRKYD